MGGNFERMMQLATDIFEVHNDPEQLDVDEKIIEQLKNLHPSAVSEYANELGPAIWVLLIPTTHELMELFVAKKIGENELLTQTPVGIKYNALYLCSALTLPEYRNKGLTKMLALNAMKEIKKTHAIETLFVWNFSEEGSWLSESIAKDLHLPLLKRPR